MQKRKLNVIVSLAVSTIILTACVNFARADENGANTVSFTSTSYHIFSNAQSLHSTPTPWNTYVIPTSGITRTPTITHTKRSEQIPEVDQNQTTADPLNGNINSTDQPTRTATPSLNNSSTFASRVTILRPPTISITQNVATLVAAASTPQYQYFFENQILPTSIYHADLENASEERFVSRCLDTFYWLENLPGREIGASSDHFDETTGYFIPQADDFDPNTYFNVLNHLHMLEGYSLDFYFNGMSQLEGWGALYARPFGGYDFTNFGDYMEYTGITDLGDAYESMRHIGDDYMDYIVGDDTPDAFFQLALLRLFGQPLYSSMPEPPLTQTLLCDRYDIDRVRDRYRNFTEEILEFIDSLDTAPTVLMGEYVVEVRLVTVSYYMVEAAVTERIYWFSRAYPYRLLDANIIWLYDENIFINP